MIAIIFSFLMATLMCFFIIRYSHLHTHVTTDPIKGGPQKFHTHPTPRIGGVAILVGMIVSTVIFALQEKPFVKEMLLLIVCSLPAFLSGFAEDITKKVGATIRLLFTMVSAIMAFLLLDVKITRLSLPIVDNLLSFIPFSLVLTMIAVAGLSHAINIIDGFNGLVSGVALLTFTSLAYVSFKVNDSFLLFVCLIMCAVIVGFFIWNYPNGMIFLGDGGAYLIGFVIAIVSVLLVNRHSEVSPWFPMLLVVYPVWETVFSVYRRFQNKKPVGIPDALHLHSLVYKRLLQFLVGKKKAKIIVKRNAMTSPYLWMLSLVAIIPAVFFWQHTVILFFFTVAFILLYQWLYFKIIKFKTPQWLIQRKKLQ
jgi:UDP-N-acetylmuramyl pentapeptide phosphotransferase/UDP-N-acetylglucosamine-1-phosphate transferase